MVQELVPGGMEGPFCSPGLSPLCSAVSDLVSFQAPRTLDPLLKDRAGSESPVSLALPGRDIYGSLWNMNRLLACPTSHPFSEKETKALRDEVRYGRVHRECRQCRARALGPPHFTSDIQEVGGSERLRAGLGLARTLDSSAELRPRPCWAGTWRCLGLQRGWKEWAWHRARGAGLETSWSLSCFIVQRAFRSPFTGRGAPSRGATQAVLRNEPATQNLEKLSENHKGLTGST